MEKDVDVVVIGAGPAGLSAALYLKRLNMRCIVIERYLPGGRLNEVPIVENLLGFGRVKGMDLAKKFLEHVMMEGIEIVFPDEVVDIKRSDRKWIITTREGRIYSAYAVIFATGMERVKFTIENEEKFMGKGVSYCAVCDGPLYRGKKVAVVGPDDKAVKEALYLSKMASEVSLVFEGEEAPSESLPDNVEVIMGRAVRIEGDDRVRRLVVKLPDGSTRLIEADAVFVARGEVPNTAILRRIGVELDERGFVKVDREQRTNVEGVFAAGDVTGRGLQIAIAMGDGAMAALSAYRYVAKVKMRRGR